MQRDSLAYYTIFLRLSLIRSALRLWAEKESKRQLGYEKMCHVYRVRGSEKPYIFIYLFLRGRRLWKEYVAICRLAVWEGVT